MNSKNRFIDRFIRRGCEFLGTRYPILCGAMTWVSEPNLVSAVSNNGGFGCLAGGNSPVHILEQQIDKTRELTDKPFAVNLITIAPAYHDHLELIKRKHLPFIIFAGGLPRKEEITIAKDSGAKVLCFAPTLSLAERLIEYGADALILEGMEAGGHIGPVSLIVLIQEILFQIADRVPVFVAGGLATGKIMAHMLLMGAAGVQLGTMFAVSEESCCHPEFKKKYIQSPARDAVATPQFDPRINVASVRALKNEGLVEFSRLQMELVRLLDEGKISKAEAQQKTEEFWIGALRRAVQEGDVKRGSLMAGQSVGLVNKILPVREIIQTIIEDAEKELQRIHQLLQ